MTNHLAHDHNTPHWLGLESNVCVVTGAAVRKVFASSADAKGRDHSHPPVIGPQAGLSEALQ